MNLATLKSSLRGQPEGSVRFVLPDGEAIPERFHVTEVGHVTKRFIDCGGTIREVSAAQLQLWLGGDASHRLTAGKLAAILDLAREIVPEDGLDVEVEYEHETISQYPIAAAVPKRGTIEIQLARKHTDCLARDTCGTEPAATGAEACCGGGCGCG